MPMPIILVCPRCHNRLSNTKKLPCKRSCTTCRVEWDITLVDGANTFTEKVAS